MKQPVKMPSLPAPKIEIINLIDVLITLIAFFMLTTVFTAKQQQMRIQLPAASQSESNMAANKLEIGLTENNEIFLADSKMQPEELRKYLQKSCRNSDLIIVKADRNCKYEWIINLLDIIRSSGLTRVAFQVQLR